MPRTTPALATACWLLGASLGCRSARPAEPAPVAIASADQACLGCHPSARAVLSGPMATRAAERAFADRAFHAEGQAFFEASCQGCHVSSCSDCHGDDGDAHLAAKPKDEACLRCHRGYFTGWEYHGRAPREDHPRYHRGPVAQGEPYLKMLPDVHAERGMGCADCHRVHGPAGATVKSCLDCHPQPAPDVPGHAIAAHLENMECSACHSAWAAQEYGTFLVRPRDPQQQELFAALPAWGAWRKSAYLKRQDAPPLALDARGRVSPVRPQFVLFASDVARGFENRLLAAEWKAFFPHTVRRGTVACGGCHDQPRRFLLEPDQERLYELEKDGLPLRSFWNRAGQRVVNGAFFPPERHALMNRKTPAYVREHLRQWQNLLRTEEPRSAR